MNTIEGTRSGLSKAALFLVTLVLSVSSCNNNDRVTPASDFSTEDAENIQSDASEDANNDDAEDLAVSALESSDANLGGKVEVTDDRLKCAEITLTGTKASGSIRIDFGTGCTGPQGVVRKGAIIIDYQGRWNQVGSFWRLRFENYSRNNVALGGLRTVTNIAADTTRLTFTVVLEDGAATWPDGSIARRRVHHKRIFERNGNHLLERLIVYGTAEGNHRNGRGYHIEILEPLVYRRACNQDLGFPLPVSGKKLIKHGERELTVDYGDGTCDNVVTITNKNGRSKNITIGD